jgi:uncharacterized protein YcgI (DUF1989 family)
MEVIAEMAIEAREGIFDRVLPPKSGLAITIKKGDHLRVIDLEGKQVVDKRFST